MDPLKFLTGVLPVLPTPFTDDDEVDRKALVSLVDFAARSGVRTVVTPAFGSEFYKLDAAERLTVIEVAGTRAVELGLKLVVQCNHSTPRIASKLAADAEALGAAAVSTALPRAFASSESCLLDYARRVCDATPLPVIVQDWNPSGLTADADFFIRLHQLCPNFRMAKLEEPGIAGTIRRIIDETGGNVGVLSGWGGSYAVQLHPAGLAGLMPGLATADVFVQLWSHMENHRMDDAIRLFSGLAPYLQFSLQNFEQFHHAEKGLLTRRGVIPSARVRQVTVDLDETSTIYLARLADAILSNTTSTASHE